MLFFAPCVLVLIYIVSSFSTPFPVHTSIKYVYRRLKYLTFVLSSFLFLTSFNSPNTSYLGVSVYMYIVSGMTIYLLI